MVLGFVYLLGKNATDDLRLSALDLKPNFKLMMVGSLEVDIQDMQNSIDNKDVIDDFDDDNDERTTYNFHKMEVSSVLFLLNIFWFGCCYRKNFFARTQSIKKHLNIYSTMITEEMRTANRFSMFKALFQIIYTICNHINVYNSYLYLI